VVPAGALPEAIAHEDIYRRRSNIGGIARFQSPNVIALSALGRTPRAHAIVMRGIGAIVVEATLDGSGVSEVP